MPKAPWFPFYPHDFLADPLVLLMTNEERGAYVLLLCHAWDPPKWGGERATLGSLPNDPMLLAALSGCGQERWGEISEHVLRPFKVSEDGRFLVQKRLTAEAEAMEQRRIAASEAGKRSAQARVERKANGTSTGVERALNGGCDPVEIPCQRNSTNHSHSHSHKEETTPQPHRGGRRGKRKGWVDESTLTPEEAKLVGHWREVCRHPNASLIASELESLRQGIADCKVLTKEFGENEHRLAWRAITGLSLSEHHMAGGYSGIRYAFRPDNLRRFIEADKARADGRAMPVQKPAESFRERDLARIQAESEARPERRVVTEEQIEEVERMRAEAAASRERGAA